MSPIEFLRIFKKSIKSLFSKIFLPKKYFENQQKNTDYNFYLPYCNKQPGVSAFIRMKNEEQKIYYCLKSIIDVFDEIIVIDNQSEDQSLEIVKEFKDKYDPDDKIKILSYPFTIARCGSEHKETPENSLHSLAYYYNYTLSHCTHKFACKWDADMVLRKEVKEKLKSFFHMINFQDLKVWKLTGKTVYRDLNNNYFAANDQVYSEQRLFPCSYLNNYGKGNFCERFISKLPRDKFPELVFFELKFTNEEEFSHWSTTDFKKLGRKRKTKEWETIEALKNNQIDLDKLTILSNFF